MELTTSLNLRFGVSGLVADLNAAIDTYRNLLPAIPSGAQQWPMVHNNPAAVLRVRFDELGDVEDLYAAERAHAEALKPLATGLVRARRQGSRAATLLAGADFFGRPNDVR
jgi:hypothetical protein